MHIPEDPRLAQAAPLLGPTPKTEAQTLFDKKTELETKADFKTIALEAGRKAEEEAYRTLVNEEVLKGQARGRQRARDKAAKAAKAAADAETDVETAAEDKMEDVQSNKDGATAF
ncbi:hypothetical protein CBER1_11526 [Cercospora berteroae]|uniref:Uncharacterized protein n=1 Tax=Cercospora berteroae TaxID=357750 RepID=A0A2S6CGZ7_9PEZI|nr:hypothetical protein CBER1_11526 [Cercospora berteroae]